jgi:NTP pyrophosphatase (non-canonical NTP hydrolase)
MEPLNLEPYNTDALRQAAYPSAGTGSNFELSYLALGLSGEAGEVANNIKKVLRDPKHPKVIEYKANMVEELGDVFWYWLRLVDALGFTPQEVLLFNETKLNARAARGELKHRDAPR